MNCRLTVAFLCLSASAFGCKGDDDDSSGSSGGGLSAAECGDPDGDGGDTGDVPNILGKWTVTFGESVYADNACTLAGLEQDDMTWINGNMEVKGRIPDNLYAIFDDNDEDRFYGVEDSQGGVVFTGTKVVSGHTLYVSVGGLLYEQPQVDRDELRGFGYMGVDEDGADTTIDCWIQADFRATKSGN